MLLYLIARHFPERMGGLKAQAIDAIVTPIAHGSYNSLSSAYSIMALDAYVAAAGPVAGGRFTVTETLKDGTRRGARAHLPRGLDHGGCVRGLGGPSQCRLPADGADVVHPRQVADPREHPARGAAH